MAKKEDKKEKKIVLERVYNVPLRKKYRRAPNWKRTNRAVKALREFVLRHMKAKEVKIGKYANLELWKHGIRNPPHHIKVNCKKDEDSTVYAELAGAPEEKPKEEPKKKAKEEKDEEVEIKVKEALGEEEEKIEELEEQKIKDFSTSKFGNFEEKEKEIKEEKADKAKEIEKEGIKELKKEHPKAHHPLKQAPIQKRIDQHPTAPLKKG